MSGPLSLRIAAVSDVGRFRKDNQDSGFAGQRLLAVCDGVGGSVRGDVASSTVLEALQALEADTSGDLNAAIESAVHAAKTRLVEVVTDHPQLAGTSTTATVVVLEGDTVVVGHVGDSRAYLLRGSELQALTTDHTFVQTLVDEGRITVDEARTHPHRNLILRVVDATHDSEVDLATFAVLAGDRLLVCSDGLLSLDDSQIADLLSNATLEEAPGQLVWAALEAGSTDNVTVLVADVVADPATEGTLTVGAAASPLAPIEALPPSRPRRTVAPSVAEGIDDDPDDADDEASELLRYAPQPPPRLGWLRRLGVLVTLVGVLWAAAAGAWWWTQQQYYVGVHEGNVTIFRGIPGELVGVELSTPIETSNVPVTNLPEADAANVEEGVDAESLADAREIVTRYGEAQVSGETPGG